VISTHSVSRNGNATGTAGNVNLGLLVIALVAGCRTINSDYCDAHPHDVDCSQLGHGCQTDDDCAPIGSCDPSSNTCVECLASADCTTAVPTCGNDHVCRGCIAQAECATACLPDGTCGTDDQVAYVDPTGLDNATCALEAKCLTLTAALATKRPYVKVDGKIKGTASIESRTVTLLGDGEARLVAATGPILAVSGTSDLTIDGVGIGDVADIGIDQGGGTIHLHAVEVSRCGGIAIRSNGGSLIVESSQIVDNAALGILAGGKLVVSRSMIARNAGGGVQALNARSVAITNNFIVRNGPNQIGGLKLDVTATAMAELDYNTIVDNMLTSGGAGGVACTGPLNARYNLIASNQLGGSKTASGAQLTGTCTFGSSTVRADVTGLLVDPTTYRPLPGSPLIDAIGTSSVPIVIDYDGDMRPTGSGSDIGADEVVP